MLQIYAVLVILTFLSTSVSHGTSSDVNLDVGVRSALLNAPQIPVGVLQKAGAFWPVTAAARPSPTDLTSWEQLQLLTSQVNTTQTNEIDKLKKDVPQFLANIGPWASADSAMTAENIGFKLEDFADVNGSTLCLNDTLQFINDWKLKKMYAIQMYNSMGKGVTVTDAILTHVLTSLGNIEQCQAVKDWNPDSPYKTTYCTMAYPVDDSYVVIGLCVPATCDATNLKEVVNKFIPDIGKYATFDCLLPYPWKPWAIVTLCILGFFLLLSVMGTLYHTIAHQIVQFRVTRIVAALTTGTGRNPNKIEENEQEHDTHTSYESNEPTQSLIRKCSVETRNECADVEGARTSNQGRVTEMEEARKKLQRLGILDTIMIGFSPTQNTSKILSTKQTAGSLDVLNGIRVISMWWIILGHTIYFMFFGFFDDLRMVVSVLESSFLFTGVLNADIGVDTFFFLSGLLVTYLTLAHLSQTNGRINWFLFYLHRFLRITPAYMISIAIWASLAIHFGQGPGKVPLFEAVAGQCREQWWTYPLYINNLYPFPGDQNAACFGWGWYLANDMQFFIISPGIIYLLYRKPKWGMALILVICLVSFGVTAYLAAYYGTSIGLQPPYNNQTLVDYGTASADVIYTKPYCRIPAYLVGMVFGYIFHCVKGKRFEMSKALNLSLWFLSVTVGVAIVFGVYRNEGHTIPQYAAVLYTVFHRPAFVLSVGWVAFSCTTGYGGPVNSLLSLSFWAPLSRITFGAYLLHPIIIYSVYTSSKVLYHFSYMQYAEEFLAQLIMAYVAAFILSIGVEGPLMGLEKTLLGRGARKKQTGEL